MMNVKCPNCRFKFDVLSIDINKQSCICPRCGRHVAIEFIKPNPVIEYPQAKPEPHFNEADMFFAAKNFRDEGRYDEAMVYIDKLLEISPDEALYRNFKEDLNRLSEEKSIIEQKYSDAATSLDDGRLEFADHLINELLQINPRDPLYLSLKERLEEKKRQKVQQIELERLKEEARRREVEQKKDTSNDIIMDWPFKIAE